MSKKSLLPTLAAPVDRASITSSGKKNDSVGAIPLTTFDEYCDWCIADCRKYATQDPNRCIRRTCDLNCWRGTDVDPNAARQTGYNTGYNNYGYNNYGYNSGYRGW